VFVTKPMNRDILAKKPRRVPPAPNPPPGEPVPDPDPKKPTEPPKPPTPDKPPGKPPEREVPPKPKGESGPDATLRMSVNEFVCPWHIYAAGYVDGELDAAARDAFRAHLPTCTACSRDVVDFLSVDNAIRPVNADRDSRFVWQRM
jgi:hypothetical protein